MPDTTIQETVKTLIQIEVVKALNSSPEAIEKLVKAALEKPVDTNGKYDGFGSKMPYLDWLVGEDIRFAAREAVRVVIKEKMPLIEEMVRTSMSSDSLVSALTKSVIGAAEQDWRIEVSFAKKER